MGREPDAGSLVGLLSDEARLRTASAVALGAGTEEQIRAATGLSAEEVRPALQRLIGAGLIEAGEDGMRLRREVLGRAARRAGEERRAARTDPTALGASEDQARVLRNFMEDGVLRSIPTSRPKRLVVLDFLAGRFEPGRVYPEKDVNLVLRHFHPDAAALRRYLVDEGFLERRDGFYWRAGGTFEVG